MSMFSILIRGGRERSNFQLSRIGIEKLCDTILDLMQSELFDYLPVLFLTLKTDIVPLPPHICVLSPGHGVLQSRFDNF